MDTKPGDSEVLPLDRYIRAVAVCNSLALLASQGTMTQFLHRLAILTQLQKYWTKGYDSVTVTCSSDANGDEDDDDNNDDDNHVEDNSPCRNDTSLAINSDVAFGSLENTDDWETHSNSTVDLKPDIDAVDLSEPEPQPQTKTSTRGNSKRRKASSKAPREVYTCSHCGETFKYRSAVVRHENQKHPQLENEQTPTEPRPSVSTKEMLLEATCQDAITSPLHHYLSRVCGKEFKNTGLLTRHQKLHDANDLPEQPTEREKAQYPCDMCNKIFHRKTWLKRHMEQHGAEKKSMQCNVCHMSFDVVGTLNDHMRIHTGERPYACRTCGKRFAQSGTRKTHELTHSNVRAHICTECGKQYKLAVHLRHHILTQHSDARPHVCEQCGRAFKLAGQLHNHRRNVHSGERPYGCEECPLRFNQTHFLKRHVLAVHRREKPYHCSVCDRAFTQPYSLRQHMRTHTGEKPYPCALCDKRFSQSGAVKAHMQTHKELHSIDNGILAGSQECSNMQFHSVENEFLAGSQECAKMPADQA